MAADLYDLVQCGPGMAVTVALRRRAPSPEMTTDRIAAMMRHAGLPSREVPAALASVTRAVDRGVLPFHAACDVLAGDYGLSPPAMLADVAGGLKVPDDK